VAPPPAGAGGLFLTTSKKTSLNPSGCRYISRQESGVLCGSIKGTPFLVITGKGVK